MKKKTDSRVSWEKKGGGCTIFTRDRKGSSGHLGRGKKAEAKKVVGKH